MLQSSFQENRSDTRPKLAQSARLDSWKEIAVFFNREVRTVQLWEKNEALPVRRHKHKKLGTVYAYRYELQAWWNVRCGQPTAQPLSAQHETMAAPNIPSLVQPWLSSEFNKNNFGHPESSAMYACMMGRYFWKQRSQASLYKALNYFKNALQQDHECYEAYAGMADCYVSLAFHQLMPTKSAMAQANAAALSALRINRKSTLSHSAYANVLLSFCWDWSNAEKACNKSTEYDSSNTQGMVVYSMLLSMLGRDSEAIQYALCANRIDPLSPTLNNALAAAYYFAGDYQQTIEVSQRTIELQPDLIRGHTRLGLAHAELGNWDAAMTTFSCATSLRSHDPHALALVAFAHAKLGQVSQARNLLKKINTSGLNSFAPMVDLAAVYAALHEKDSALDCLNKAFANRDMRAILLRRDPRFKGLHNDHQFKQIIDSISLLHKVA